MGYALLFARKIHNNSRKNQLTFETMSIQRQKTNITKQITNLQTMAQGLDENSPDLQSLDMYKQILVNFENNLDLRMQCIQTEMAKISAEEQSLGETLDAQIKSSAPHYAS